MSRLMRGVGQLLDYTFNSLDVSSGANDVIVIEQPDGTLKCSPFNVRFGKLKVVRSREKIVHVEVNGAPTKAYMKIGAAGEAHWLLPTNKRTAMELLSSPLHSPKDSPITSPVVEPSVPEEVPTPVDLGQSPPTTGVKEEEPALSPRSLQAIDARLAQQLSLTHLHEQLVAAAQSPRTELGAAAATGELRLSDPKAVAAPRRSSQSPPTVVVSPPPVVKFSPPLGPGTPQVPPSPQRPEGADDEEVEEYSESDDDEDGTKYWMISALPSMEQLAKLNLKRGVNIVKFITHSSIRGKQEIAARIYLWNCHAQIVVSDVDGTVTRSDVLGHILPRIGKDWTHEGICSFYSRIANNGYKVLYLTARSIGQLETTRTYLQEVVQNGVSLPDGPVLGAPDRIFTALTREVITKTPYEFKIACLKGVMKAFPSGQRPFYAGLGNRIGDVISYTAVGIPNHKVLIIDVKSQVHICNTTATYSSLTDLVNEGFPAVCDDRVSAPPPVEYNSMFYWDLDVKSYFAPNADTACPFIEEGQTYHLLQLRTEKVLSVVGAGMDIRTYLEVADAAVPPNTSQLWTFDKKVVGGQTFYNIRNVKSKKGMNVQKGSVEAAARVWQFDNYEATHTQWQVVVVNRTLGTVRIVNRNSGRCATVDAAGAVVQGPKDARNDDFSVTWQIVAKGPLAMPPVLPPTVVAVPSPAPT